MRANRKQWRRAPLWGLGLVVATCLVLAVAACGGGSDAEGTTAQTTTPPAEETTAPAETGGGETVAATGEDCQPHSIDLGDDMAVEGGCEPLKIAFLSAATNNVYLQAGMQGAQDAAAAAGATIEVFDGGWSPETQYNQVQNLIASGEFNAVLAEMADGNQACEILTQAAPEANLLVAVANQPLCDRATNEGDELWSPGTLTFVGGSQGREAFRDWLFQIAEENPGPQKVAVLTGPDLNANTINTDLAIEDVKAQYPEFEIVEVARTDYSVPQGQEKAQALLQANPDLTILIGNYSDITRGAAQAAQQADRVGSLKIYDNGGNEWAFGAVRDGLITSTRTLTPYTEMVKAVEALVASWNGEEVPRYIPLEAVLITKDNIDQYEPEY